jgi:hypothetical protein
MNIITFNSVTQAILLAGGATLIFAMIGVFITLAARKKFSAGRKARIPRWVSILSGIFTAALIVSGVVAISVNLTAAANDSKLMSLLAENDVTLTPAQFETLQQGTPVQVGEDTVALVPIDDSYSYELFVAPTEQAKQQEADIGIITTPANEN